MNVTSKFILEHGSWISLEQYLNNCHKQRPMHKGLRINDWKLVSFYNEWEHPPTIPIREGHKKILIGMKASPMISSWHLCRGAIADKMGYSLGHRGDIPTQIFPLSSNFLLTKKGGLVDLRDVLIWKSKLWAYDSKPLSPSHLCCPIEYTNTVVFYNIHLKKGPYTKKAWKKGAALQW